MWYRVVDRAHPLWGLEVCGDLNNQEVVLDGSDDALLDVKSVRRLEVFVGDRPMQISRVRGMWLSMDILEESPIQEDVQLEVGPPYGKCLEEDSMEIGSILRTDGLGTNAVKVTVALYERAATVAVVECKSFSAENVRVLVSDTCIGTFPMNYIRSRVNDAPSWQSLVDSLHDGSFWNELVVKGGGTDG